MGNDWTAKRYEKKYIVTTLQYMKLKELLKDITRADKHGNKTICNIYFDTPDFKLVRKSLEKPVYKEKFRIRSYGIADDNSEVFAEIKKKYDGVVYKRRVSFKHNEMFGLNINQLKEISTETESQILSEIDSMFNLYDGLQPKMFICYDREALFTTDESGIRLTFDKNIMYRTEDLVLDKHTRGHRVLDRDKYILEVKTGAAMPIWLAEALNTLKIYPASFSKYGVAYQKFTGEVIIDGHVA